MKPILPIVDEKKIKEFCVKKNRDRVVLPNRLPTKGLLPFPIDEHEHIGNYESKQNLYLILAHAYNKCMERIEKLEEGNR